MLRPLILIASLTLASVLLPAGCPTDPSGGDNSNSAANENGSTGNSNGSANENGGGGSENENGADNSNGGSGSNENSNSSANENSNSSGNSNENGDDTPGPSIVAAWSGSLACERTQALSGGSPGNPTSSSQSLAITFGSDNKPASIVVLGYSSFADQTVTLKNAGDTVTNNVSASNYTGTMQMTIASVDYRSDRCEIVVDIVLQSTSSGNGATQNGTGRQTITARTVGDGLEYTAESEYEVRLQTGAINLDVTESKTCTGTLAK